MGALALTVKEGRFVDLALPDGRIVSVRVVRIQKLNGNVPEAVMAFTAPQDVTIARRELGKPREAEAAA